MDVYQPIKQKEIERAYFFLTHKNLFKKIAYALAIFIVVVIYIFLIIGIIGVVRNPNFDNMAAQINSSINWAAYHSARAPEPLFSGASKFLSLGENRYNLVSFVENPNTNWAAGSFKYKFIVNGQELETKETFLNPGEKRLLLRMSYESSQPINDLKMNLGDVSWYRVDNDIPQIAWDIREASYFPSRTITEDGKDLEINPLVTWQAQNLSLYDFWEVDWQIALFDGDNLVGVNEAKSRDFKSLESRDIEVAWLKDLPRVTKVQIFPVLNWLDKDNFTSYYQEEREVDRVNF